MNFLHLQVDETNKSATVVRDGSIYFKCLHLYVATVFIIIPAVYIFYICSLFKMHFLIHRKDD